MDPIIQRASERALAHGTRLKDVLGLAREIRAARPDAGLVIFSYLNPILRYGLRRFADDAAAAGVDGVLAIDMIVEEAGEYLSEMSRVEPRADFPGCADESRRTARGDREEHQRVCVRDFACGRHRHAAKCGCRRQGAGRARSSMDETAGGGGVRDQQRGTRGAGGGVRGRGGDRERNRRAGGEGDC